MACFCAKICTIYQIYILQKLIVELKISARIRSERSSMAKVRWRQRIEVATRSHTILNEKLLRQKYKLETLGKAYKVSTRKIDVVTKI